MWIDLGEPLLFLILVFWGLFVGVAFIWTFIDKKNRQSLKEFLNRVFQTSPHKGHQRARE